MTKNTAELIERGREGLASPLLHSSVAYNTMLVRQLTDALEALQAENIAFKAAGEMALQSIGRLRARAEKAEAKVEGLRELIQRAYDGRVHEGRFSQAWIDDARAALKEPVP